MWSARVKQLFHPFFCILRYAIETGMLEPVLGSVLSERKLRQAVFGDAVGEVK
jgi:hypothetical protein